MFNFFEISIEAINLLSIMIGMGIGLSTGAFNRYRAWWLVVLYLVFVCLHYALKAGAFAQYIR
jgi:predicted Na+-dependent transporter